MSNRYFFSIEKGDKGTINAFLKILVEKGSLNLNQTSTYETYGIDADKARSLALFIVKNGYAREHGYTDNVILSNTETADCYKLGYLDKQIDHYFDKEEQEKRSEEKIILEIESLKKKNGLIKPAFLISIISALIAAASLILSILQN